MIAARSMDVWLLVMVMVMVLGWLFGIESADELDCACIGGIEGVEDVG